MDAAETVPRAVSAALVAAGVLLVQPELGAVPFVPLPVLSVQFVRGLSERVDLRLRYDSVGLMTHRLGAGLRVRLWRAHGWSIGVGVEASAQQFVLPYQDAYLGGDLATQPVALVTHRWSSAALTLAVGPTLQWLVVGQSGGRTLADLRPHLGYLDVGARLEWSRGPGRTMVLGLDLCVPVDPDDPLGILGVLPRVTLGWTWSR